MDGNDGQYSHAPWDREQPSTYGQPSSPWEGRMISDALLSLRESALELAQRPCPLPQVGRDPRFGYDRAALGVLDVLGENRLYATRQNDFSGSPAGYEGSIRNSLYGA